MASKKPRTSATDSKVLPINPAKAGCDNGSGSKVNTRISTEETDNEDFGTHVIECADAIYDLFDKKLPGYEDEEVTAALCTVFANYAISNGMRPTTVIGLFAEELEFYQEAEQEALRDRIDDCDGNCAECAINKDSPLN